MTNSVQFELLDYAVTLLGGNSAGAWRCRFRNFAIGDLPCDNLLPEQAEAEYLTTDQTERKFRFHVRHMAAAVDDAGQPLDGADRAADARYVRGAGLLMADRYWGGRIADIREAGQKWEMEPGTLQIMALVVTYEIEFSTKNNDPGTAGY